MWEIIHTLSNLVNTLGYAWIFFMMVLESSFFPFPSELAMIPAGYLSHTWDMFFPFAFIAWTLWALVWATINYFIGMKLGWPVVKKLIEKYGKYFLLNTAQYDKIEYFFLDHGSVATFIWRLITWIRQIISLPAGVFKMNFPKFLLYTSVWAWLWNLVLMLIGYIAGQNEDLIKEYSFYAFIGAFIFVWLTIYTYYQRKQYPKRAKSTGLVYINDKNEILLQKRESISKHWEKWALFGWKVEFQEKPRHAIVRELRHILWIDVSDSAWYLGKIHVKIPERHTIARRYYYYDFTKKLASDFQLKEWDWAEFMSIEKIKKLDGFYAEGKWLDKLIKLMEKAVKKVTKENANNTY